MQYRKRLVVAVPAYTIPPYNRPSSPRAHETGVKVISHNTASGGSAATLRGYRSTKNTATELHSASHYMHSKTAQAVASSPLQSGSLWCLTIGQGASILEVRENAPCCPSPSLRACGWMRVWGPLHQHLSSVTW